MTDWDPLGEPTQVEVIDIDGVIFRQGSRVRLKPRGGADIMDLALSGRTATIVAIEQDWENRVHLAVTIDDDPGKEWGVQRQTGHRFFFAPPEVELLAADERRAR